MAYRFPISGTAKIDLSLSFDGDIPILGGQHGKANAKAQFEAVFAAPVNGKASITDSLKSFQVDFNGFQLPLTLKDALKYFPTTTFLTDPSGGYESQSKTNIKTPVRLPGLSLDNVPRITFAPFQIPPGLIAVGDQASYDAKIQGGTETVQLKVMMISTDRILLSVHYVSHTSGLEDSAEMVTDDPKSAASKVETTDEGSGTAVYSKKLGMFSGVSITDNAVTKVTAIDTHAKTERKLNRVMTIALQMESPSSSPVNPKPGGSG